MYRYRSNLAIFRNTVSRVSEVLVLLTLSLLFYMFKTLDTSVYGVLLTVAIAIGVLVVLRRITTLYLCLTLFLLVVLTYSLLTLFSLHVSWGFIVDLLLVLTILLTYTYYRYVDGVGAVFLEYIPFALIVSTIVGTYLGVENTLRYLLLTLIDSMTSVIIFSIRRDMTLGYVSSFLYFIILYLSPLVDLNLSVLTIFTILHFMRNILTFSSAWDLRNRGITSYVLGLDILLKPLVIVVWT